MASVYTFFHKRQVVPYVFLAPFVFFFFVFKVWPVLYALLLSFQEVEGVGAGSWVGLRNYLLLLNDPRFHKALFNTSYYTLGTLVLLIPIPLILSALLHSGLVKTANASRTMLFLPVLTSLVVVGTVFRLLLADTGLVNSVITAFGLPAPEWLEAARWAVPSMLLMAFWRWTGMNIVYFTAGLANIPHELSEAASIDGANAFQRFIYVTVPMLKPITIFVVALTLIGGFQAFTEPYTLWPEGRTPRQGGLTIALYLYRKGFSSFNMGYASTIGVVLAIIIMAVSLAQFKTFGFFEQED